MCAASDSGAYSGKFVPVEPGGGIRDHDKVRVSTKVNANTDDGPSWPESNRHTGRLG